MIIILKYHLFNILTVCDWIWHHLTLLLMVVVEVKVLHRETFPFSLRFPGTVTIPHPWLISQQVWTYNVESISIHKPPELIPLSFKKHLVDAWMTVHCKGQRLEWVIPETHPGLSFGPQGNLFKDAKPSGAFCQFPGGCGHEWELVKNRNEF